MEKTMSSRAGSGEKNLGAGSRNKIERLRDPAGGVELYIKMSQNVIINSDFSIQYYVFLMS